MDISIIPDVEEEIDIQSVTDVGSPLTVVEENDYNFRDDVDNESIGKYIYN